MIESTNNFQSNIISAINTLKRPEKETGYRCTVIECIDENSGEYRLTYLDIEITAYAMGNKVYEKGDNVIVISPSKILMM